MYKVTLLKINFARNSINFKNKNLTEFPIFTFNLECFKFPPLFYTMRTIFIYDGLNIFKVLAACILYPIINRLRGTD